MILATKNPNKICYYNTKEEKDELIRLLGCTEYKIFSNADKEKAQLYSDKEKITGFKSENEDSFEIFRELYDVGTTLVSFTGIPKNSDKQNKYFVVLKSLFYIDTNKMISHISSIDMFNIVEFSGNKNLYYDNFLEELELFQKGRKILWQESIEIYLKEYNELIHKYPWDILRCTTIFNNKDYIEFKNIGEGVDCERINTNEIRYSLKNNKNYLIFDKENIFDIKTEILPNEITDKEILSVIREI